MAFGTGIAVYFTILFEPNHQGWLIVAALFAGLALLRFFVGETPRILLTGLLLILAGFATAGLRTHWVAATVLDYRYYGPIEGRVVAIDRSASDAVRLTLDRVILGKLSQGRTPERVRVALHGDQGFVDPVPGLTAYVFRGA